MLTCNIQIAEDTCASMLSTTTFQLQNNLFALGQKKKSCVSGNGLKNFR